MQSEKPNKANYVYTPSCLGLTGKKVIDIIFGADVSWCTVVYRCWHNIQKRHSSIRGQPSGLLYDECHRVAFVKQA